MPAAVISIETKRRACWSLLEIAQTGRRPIPYGILLADEDGGVWAQRLREIAYFGELDEPEADILAALPADLKQKAREMGGLSLLAWLEDTLSNFLRISDRTSIVYSDAQAAADRLFDEHVDGTVGRFVTHLPLYGLRAAATEFGGEQELQGEPEGWVRAPENLRLTEAMFVARVVGRSMEPLIPDGSLCIFRKGVAGSRKNRFLLIEKFDESDVAARYTVKKYAKQGDRDESAEREDKIRLEPLNPEFEPFDLTSDNFRVVAEFLQVLPS